MNNRAKKYMRLLASLFILGWLAGCTPQEVEPVIESNMSTPTAHPMFSPNEKLTLESNLRPPPVVVDITPSEKPSPPSTVANQSVDNGVVPILLYHHVGEAAPGMDAQLSVDLNHFREQIAYLYANGYNAISFDTLVSAMDNNEALPSKPVIITFDNGYVDNYENAFPILQDAGFTTTFFITTSFVNAGLAEYMSWEMLTEMVAAGMILESHSHTNVNLLEMNREMIVEEVESSLSALSAHVEYEPKYFSYPFGQYNDLVIDVLQELEIEGAVTAVSNNTLTLDFPYEWGRIPIGQDATLPDFITLLETGPVAVGAANAPTIPAAEIVPGYTNIITATIYADMLNSNWDLINSQRISYSRQDATRPYAGEYHLTATASEPAATLHFTVREQSGTSYRRDKTMGIRFWLYSDTVITNEDFSLIVEGSNNDSHWISGDVSASNADVLTFSGQREYDLGFNQTVPPNTWVQIEILLDDLVYDPGYDDTPVDDAYYEYLTGFILQFEGVDVSTIFVDSVELLMFETEE
ncbi:MAG: polysaccharide deacetylase family protein [Chloroflexi bacterium]|nr:polysaccharide deacetylase family protein [Chloroflexota bacterium]